MTLRPIDVCEMAIIALFRAHYRFIKFPFCEPVFQRRARAEAKALLESGDEGIRYGDQLGWPNTWLVYRGGVFSLLGGGGEDYQKFRATVVAEFEAIGLELH